MKKEFVPITSPIPTSSTQEQVIPTSVVPPTNPLTTPLLNICMMCKITTNGIAHEDSTIAAQTYFSDVKSLASRLMVGIHTDEIEKKLLK